MTHHPFTPKGRAWLASLGISEDDAAMLVAAGVPVYQVADVCSAAAATDHPGDVIAGACILIRAQVPVANILAVAGAGGLGGCARLAASDIDPAVQTTVVVDGCVVDALAALDAGLSGPDLSTALTATGGAVTCATIVRLLDAGLPAGQVAPLMVANPDLHDYFLTGLLEAGLDGADVLAVAGMGVPMGASWLIRLEDEDAFVLADARPEVRRLAAVVALTSGMPAAEARPIAEAVAGASWEPVFTRLMVESTNEPHLCVLLARAVDADGTASVSAPLPRPAAWMPVPPLDALAPGSLDADELDPVDEGLLADGQVCDWARAVVSAGAEPARVLDLLRARGDVVAVLGVDDALPSSLLSWSRPAAAWLAAALNAGASPADLEQVADLSAGPHSVGGAVGLHGAAVVLGSGATVDDAVRWSQSASPEMTALLVMFGADEDDALLWAGSRHDRLALAAVSMGFPIGRMPELVDARYGRDMDFYYPFEQPLSVDVIDAAARAGLPLRDLVISDYDGLTLLDPLVPVRVFEAAFALAEARRIPEPADAGRWASASFPLVWAVTLAAAVADRPWGSRLHEALHGVDVPSEQAGALSRWVAARVAQDAARARVVVRPPAATAGREASHEH